MGPVMMSYGAYDCYKKRSGVCLGCSRVLWEIYEEFMLAIVILGGLDPQEVRVAVVVVECGPHMLLELNPIHWGG